MNRTWIILVTVLLVLLVGVIARLGQGVSQRSPAPAPPAAPAPAVAPLRLGIVPERDIYTQRRRYQALAKYLGAALGRDVELVTTNTYQGVLHDFQDRQIDVAFLGSLVAVLAVDRLDAKVALKAEQAGGVTGYHGVIFVKDDAPIRGLDDLPGRSIGMVRTTTAAHMFPMWVLIERGLLGGPDAPRLVWMGTHDDVIAEVAAGRVEVGAVKNTRLENYQAANPQTKLRPLARSESVPDVSVVLRADLAADLERLLIHTLESMPNDERGLMTLKTFGAQRFIPCRIEEFKAVYDMADALGPRWSEVGVDGPPPRRPAAQETRQDP